MRAAIIEDGVVVACIVVDGEGPDWVLCPDEVNPGWTYDGTTWTPPAEEPVAEI